MNIGDEKGADFFFFFLQCAFMYKILTLLDPGVCSGISFLFLCLTTGCILDSVVSEVNPGTVLELGTYCGYSTVRIASLLPPHAKFITLEFNPDFAAIARQVIAWAGLQDKVKSSIFTRTEIEIN